MPLKAVEGRWVRGIPWAPPFAKRHLALSCWAALTWGASGSRGCVVISLPPNRLLRGQAQRRCSVGPESGPNTVRV